jgi:hypothetical protein
VLPRVLIVEHNAITSPINYLGALDARTLCERTTWSHFRAEGLLRCSAQLVLANATPITDKVD